MSAAAVSARVRAYLIKQGAPVIRVNTQNDPLGAHPNSLVVFVWTNDPEAAAAVMVGLPQFHAVKPDVELNLVTGLID